jgi:DNA modification methylase
VVKRSGEVVRIHDEHELLPVSSLVPYARNSRTHSDDQVAQIAASLREFGFTNPVLVDEAGGIIAGHGRVMAAQSLGLDRVPCLRLRGLSEAQKRAYVIADNKIALNAGWDNALLRAELDDLKAMGYGIDVVGFSAEELESLFDPVAEDNGADPDAAPDMRESAVTGGGDAWVMGPHRAVCGDATQLAAWESLMGTELADAVWTDPPYNVAYESKLAGKIQNDDMSDSDFAALLSGAFGCLAAVMKPGASIYVAHADTEGYAFRRAFSERGFKLSGCLIWKKNALVLGRSDYQWIHEPILYGWKPGSKHRWFGGRKQVTVQEMGDASPFTRQEDGSWVIRVGDQTMVVSGDAKVQGPQPTSVLFHEKPSRSSEHPTMKPVGLIERMLAHSARPGDIVADAFGGSGSTLMAAERLGMCARLMELDPRFVDVIVRRWQDYTGRQAILESTCETFDQVAARRAA